ncbi:MAG: hypothetical protein Q9201_006487 [Fulgogasparrea decipioides]
MVIREFHLVAHSSDSRKEEMMGPPRQHEFDSFPPAVKRKYFSSLERLRLAQRPLSIETGTTSASIPHTPGATQAPTRPSRPRLSSRNSSYFKASPSRLVRKATPPSDRFSFEDAQWFQRLPDKVRQKHFTKDEQRALAGQRTCLILDAADEVVLRAGRPRIHSVPTVPISYTHTSRASSVHALEDEPPVDSAVDMDESFFNSFRWMDDDDDLDLTLDDYHTHLVSSAEPGSGHNSRRPSFRRTLSLTALPRGEWHRPISAERDLRPPPLPSILPCNPYQRGSSPPRTDHRAAAPANKQNSFRSTDQSAKYYQDPEARLKLRVYLASPSKFDEALEFGFPSLESSDHLPEPRRPSISRNHHTEPAPQTFYDSESPSFLDGSDCDSDDAESLPEMETPKTPSDAMFFRSTHRLPTSKPPSSDVDRPFSKISERLKYKPVEQHQPQHQPYVVSGCNREMTLRMTLTRPDLRASEDLLYAPGDNDPLALEQLPSPAFRNDIWDQGKESGGTMKNLLRRFGKR